MGPRLRLTSKPSFDRMKKHQASHKARCDDQDQGFWLVNTFILSTLSKTSHGGVRNSRENLKQESHLLYADCRGLLIAIVAEVGY